MKRALLVTTLLLPLAAVAQPCTRPDCTVAYPADAGAIDVRRFGAKGDGHTDDTKAILDALAASGGFTGTKFWQDRPVYLPNGTYLVSAPILKRYADGRFASGLMLMGQSVQGTVLKLADAAPGYGNSTQPRAVVFTAARLVDQGGPYGGGKDYPNKGEGNDAYENFVENLTIDVGRGNPGAIGIDYLANNIGAVRDVLLRAGPDSGAIGISLQRKWPGPALISHVSVEGFSTGIAAAQTEYGITLQHLRLSGQRGPAIRNDGNMLALRDVSVQGAGQALVNDGASGMIVWQGGKLAAPPEAAADAVLNRGVLVMRGVTVQGYASVSGAPASAAQNGLAQRGDSHLPVPAWRVAPAEPPPVPEDPPSRWVRVAPVADGADATGAIRAAFASGAGTVYFPHGTWFITDAIEVPPSLHRIVGMNSTIRILPQRQPGFSRAGGMFRVLQSGLPLRIEKLAFDNSDMGQQLAVEVFGPRSVELRDIVSAGTALVERRPGGGALFIEDVCCGEMGFAGPAPVQASQLDTEGAGIRIRVVQAPVSILGLKTEGVVTALSAREGAQVDVVGGLLYMVRDAADPPPAFTVDDARLMASYAEEVLRPTARYRVHLARPGHSVTAEELSPRGLGRFATALQ